MADGKSSQPSVPTETCCPRSTRKTQDHQGHCCLTLGRRRQFGCPSTFQSQLLCPVPLGRRSGGASGLGSRGGGRLSRWGPVLPYGGPQVLGLVFLPRPAALPEGPRGEASQAL